MARVPQEPCLKDPSFLRPRRRIHPQKDSMIIFCSTLILTFRHINDDLGLNGNSGCFTVCRHVTIQTKFLFDLRCKKLHLRALVETRKKVLTLLCKRKPWCAKKLLHTFLKVWYHPMIYLDRILNKRLGCHHWKYIQRHSLFPEAGYPFSERLPNLPFQIYLNC